MEDEQGKDATVPDDMSPDVAAQLRFSPIVRVQRSFSLDKHIFSGLRKSFSEMKLTGKGKSGQ